ncbi:MAG: type I secretion system permease/ATPase [Caulobacteraceae bacterium]|nr:type I secretion system permease/ATPase [Caulobacteraceae bacterium]
MATPIAAALAACKRHFIAAAIFSALLNLLYLSPTLYMLQVYDRVVPSRGLATLAFLTFVLLAALGALALLDMVRSRLLVRASVRLDRILSGAILDATLSQPAASREGLTKQALREFDTFRQTLTGVGVLALFDAPWTPIYVLVCFIIHPALGLLALVGAAALLFLTWRNERATRARIQSANEAANIAYVNQEFSAASADVIRSLGMRQAFVRRHLHEREAANLLQAQASFAGGGYMTMTRFLRLSLQSLALGLGALLAIENKISPGAIFAASILMARALAPIEQVLGAWRNVVQARGAFRALTSLLQHAASRRPSTLLPPPRGVLETERLTVLAPGRQATILRDVSFRVEAGEAVGVVGPSGAGKSTLARVLAGAALADHGGVRFDGADAKDWDPERLAQFVGFLPQAPTLFAGTVKENIARFRTAMDEDVERIDEMVVQAAKKCGAHEMILRLGDGYETVIGWGDKGLSAGQAQRIALARALFGDPSVLILDEPNAHLDADGEAVLVRTLADLKAAGTTILVVAHRTGVLAAVDKLMVLQEGRLELYGPRDEVIQRISAPAHVRPAAAPAPAHVAPAAA